MKIYYFILLLLFNFGCTVGSVEKEQVIAGDSLCKNHDGVASYQCTLISRSSVTVKCMDGVQIHSSIVSPTRPYLPYLPFSN